LKRLTTKLRNERGLPPIADPNDLPDPKDQADYISVLTEKQQEQLRYQQEKFGNSQTWYRPHATATHTAFPINWALWNTILMDGNSVFQCMLCGCMWGLTWHVRPPWTTGCLIPCSFLCGITAGILIWQGSVRTKKREHVEDRLRAALGVPLAISGISTTKDGTIITSNNRAPTPPASNSTSGPNSSPSKTTLEKIGSGESHPGRGRGVTVTFGNVRDPIELQDVGRKRERGATLAAPARGEWGMRVGERQAGKKDERRSEVERVEDV